MSNAVVRKTVGACTESHRRDWTPLSGKHYDRVRYGHDIENVWLLMEACTNAGLARATLSDLHRTLFDYALGHGFDWRHGGFFEAGRLGSAADAKDKLWWVQAEALVAALSMYAVSKEPRYLSCFLQTLDWVISRQADWKHGEWHSRMYRGRPRDEPKAGAWKDPYHQGRAVLRCLELVSDLSPAAGGTASGAPRGLPTPKKS
jgi:mannobiose 2-epimerase